MKIGKIPEVVLKRSVFKLIKHRRKEVLVKPGVGLDCSQIELGNDEILVMSTDPITGTSKNIGTLAANITANDIACSGADIIGLMVSILLPKVTEEDVLKNIMKELEDVCEQNNMEILGGHTEVTDVVSVPVITVTGVGKIKKNKRQSADKVKEGYEIVMTKWAGLEGSAIIAKEKEEELLTRYNSDLVDSAKEFFNHISIVKDARIASDNGAVLMHDVTEGGVFGALWELSSATKLGIEVDLKKIPLRQETVEICEFYDINPYMLISSGSLLIATIHGNQLVKKLNEAGIDAAVIGRFKKGNNKEIHNDDEIRFLEPPSVDELYKVVK